LQERNFTRAPTYPQKALEANYFKEGEFGWIEEKIYVSSLLQHFLSMQILNNMACLNFHDKHIILGSNKCQDVVIFATHRRF